MTNFLRMQSYSRARRNHEWMCRHSDIHRHTHPPSILVFLFSSLSSSLSLTPWHTHTRKTERERQRESERERKQHRDRARRRTGKGNSCAVLPLHSFLLGWSFPSGGERDCKLSKRTVRKQEAPSSSRESEMKSICGPCSPGRLGGPLLERRFVRRYPSYGQGGSHCQKPLCYLVIVSVLTPNSKVKTDTPEKWGNPLIAATTAN